MTFELGGQRTYFRYRRLTPAQRLRIRAAHSAGATVVALAHAYGVTPRTIYRSIERAGHATVQVTVAEFVACFELEDGYPIQVTPWVPT